MLVDSYELIVRYLAAAASHLQAACVSRTERRPVQKVKCIMIMIIIVGAAGITCMQLHHTGAQSHESLHTYCIVCLLSIIAHYSTCYHAHCLTQPYRSETGVAPDLAARVRRRSASSKQHTAGHDHAAAAVLAPSVRRSQRQLHQRQVRDKQQQAQIQHNVTVNARVSDSIALLASPPVTASRARPECAVEASGQSEENGADAAVESGRRDTRLCQQSRQQRVGKSGRAVQGAASKSSKGVAHSPSGVKKQTSPVGKVLSKGTGLGARFPLRVRKNLEESQANLVKHDKQGRLHQNRGLADTNRPAVC